MTRHPIIDTHVHFWDMATPGLGMKWVWLEKEFVHPILGDIDAMKSVKYTIDSVFAESRFADVSGFVHVQAALGSEDPVSETRWLTEMRKNAPVPFTIVAHADLGTEHAMAQLDGHGESPYFVGVRDFAAEPMLASGEINPVYEESLRVMTDRGLVFDLDCEWFNMAAGTALARRHPELNIVLEHIGFPRSRDDEYFGNWKRSEATVYDWSASTTLRLCGHVPTRPSSKRADLRVSSRDTERTRCPARPSLPTRLCWHK